jgi:hypothetical protein
LYRHTSIDQAGDVAVATLVEEGCWGTVSFVDYFSHTGGTPPF